MGYQQNRYQCTDTKKPNNEETSDKTNQSDQSPVRIGYLNLRSINNKTIQVRALIEQLNFAVFLATETWLKPISGNQVLQVASPNKYSSIHQPREGRGGGVAVTYSDDLKMTKIDLIKATTFEYVSVEMENKEWDKSLLIINVYRPKETTISKFQQFLEELRNLLSKAYKINTRILLTGDFNVWVDAEKKKRPRTFLSMLERNGLSQYVKEPTHEKGHILDLVIGLNVEISELEVINHNMSDHYTIYFNARPLSEGESDNESESDNDDEEQTKQQKKNDK